MNCLFQDILRSVHKDIKLSFHQKNPSPSVCVPQLRVQRGTKEFPLAVGLKQETTQKPSAGGGREFPVPQDQVDIFTGSTSGGSASILPPPHRNGGSTSSKVLSVPFADESQAPEPAQIWPLHVFVE